MRRPQILKKSPTCFDKTAVFLSRIKTSGRLFFKLLWHFQKSWTLSGYEIINNIYNFFDLVKLFVNLRGMDIYAWDTFTQLRLDDLHSYFLGPGISRFCLQFYPFGGLNGELLCMQHLLQFSFKFWTLKAVKTWKNGKFLFWKCLL